VQQDIAQGRSCLPLVAGASATAETASAALHANRIASCPSWREAIATYISRAPRSCAAATQAATRSRCSFAQQPFNGTSFTGKAANRHPAAGQATTRPCCSPPPCPWHENGCCGPQTTAEGGVLLLQNLQPERRLQAPPVCPPPPGTSASRRGSLMARSRGSIAAMGLAPFQWPPVAAGRLRRF